MLSRLQRYLSSGPPTRHPLKLFEDADPEVTECFMGLWRKYESELLALSTQLALKYREMTANGLGAGFGDVEGELLYILIRELRPLLVYEISPNSGFSSNYILAAVTKNGSGRVEGFELLPEFLGKPTADVIRSNFVGLCDASRYHLNVGDARVTALQRLRTESPDFALIDSCHDDFFGEFYVKELFPVLPWVFIQDIAHFDPRPEGSTEAYYVLSYLQEKTIPFLPVGVYEDALTASGVRGELIPRRPVRSNSLVLHLEGLDIQSGGQPDVLISLAANGASGDVLSRASSLYPLNGLRTVPRGISVMDIPASGRPEDRYILPWHRGQVDQDCPRFADLISLREGKAKASDTVLDHLVSHFHEYDVFCQVSIVEILARCGTFTVLPNLLDRLAGQSIRGSELPLRLARAAWKAGLRREMYAWITRCRTAGRDPSVAVGYRQLLEAARLLAEAGDRESARDLFCEALQHIRARGDAVHRKASREVLLFCAKHPAFIPLLSGGGVDLAEAMNVVPYLVGRLAQKALSRLVPRRKHIDS